MSNPFKYKLNELSRYVSNEIVPAISVQKCYVDSRHVEPYGLFFALKGNHVDGHAYLGEAAQKGAVAAIIQRDYAGPDYGLVLIKVSDPLQALQNIARQELSRRGTRVVGITGSVGKTTAKEFTYHLLKQKYSVAASPGNSNSQIGLPLAILNHADGQEKVLILEMGMTEAGQIKQLVDIAPPEVAVITKAALVHAQNFTGLEAIGVAKAEIFSNPRTQLGLVSRDIVNFEEVCQVGSCRKVSFSGTGLAAEAAIKRYKEGLIIDYQQEQSFLPDLPLHGEHNLHNFLCAAAVARYFEVEWEDIRLAIPHLSLPEKRLQFTEKGGILFVNDSYNASEISVKAALNSLPEPAPGGKKIAILGEMLELGRFSEQCHYEVGKHALPCASHMICFGQECKVIYDLWKSENRFVQWVMTLEEVILALKSIVNPGDVVLLKGSRAKGLWKVLDAI